MENFITDLLFAFHNYLGTGPLVAILLFLATCLFTVTYRRNARHFTFKKPLLPIIDILRKEKLPVRSEYVQLTDELFTEQDNAMLIIQDRLKCSSRDIFTQKWDEYKKQREPYKERSFIAHWNFAGQKGNNETLTLIYEILDIANHN